MSTSTDPTLADVHPGRALPHERSRIRAAALHATRVLTPAIGALVKRELLASDDLGLRIAPGSLIDRVAAELLATPTPEAKPRVHAKVPGG